MPSFATLKPTSVRRWFWLPVAFALVVAAVLFGAAGPARADILPTLTSFHVSATSVDVTTGDAHISVTMSVSDPDATGAGTGDIIAHGPTRGYWPSANLVQVGGTATNTQYRAGITLPAGKAVDYHMDITFEEAGEFFLVDLQSQLAASDWPYHVQSEVTAPPKAATNLTFHRDLGPTRRRPAGAHRLDGDRHRLRHAAELQLRRRGVHRSVVGQDHVHRHREPAQQRRQLAAGHRNRPDLSRVPHQRRV
jgi:hypothetical protein